MSDIGFGIIGSALPPAPRACRLIAALCCAVAISLGAFAAHAQAQERRERGASMSRGRFWKVVEEARSGARDDQVFLQRLAAHLQTLKPPEIVDFERHFRQLHADSYRWELWGAAYLVQGGCSDDCFEYFRAWLIAQ